MSRPSTTESYYSASCRFAYHDECEEWRLPTKFVEGLVYLVCACRCHEAQKRRESEVRSVTGD